MNDLKTYYYIFKCFKDTYDFSLAITLCEECEEIVLKYDRGSAIAQMQKVITEYESEIVQLSLFGGRTVEHNVDYDTLGDKFIIDALSYLARNIPLYALLKKGEEKFVEEALKRGMKTNDTSN